MAEVQTPKASGVSKRGFASMDPERQREIARKGGASVPSEKRSFSQDRSLAAQAGRKGGEASHGSRRNDETPPPAE
ncbi:MAG TPA: general stress protein [Brevundimonas sp.]